MANYLVREFVRVHVILYMWLYALEIMMSTASNLRRIEKEKGVVFQKIGIIITKINFVIKENLSEGQKMGTKGACACFAIFIFE